MRHSFSLAAKIDYELQHDNVTEVPGGWGLSFNGKKKKPIKNEQTWLAIFKQQKSPTRGEAAQKCCQN